MDTETNRKLVAIGNILEEFKKVDPQITLPSILAFIYAAQVNGEPGSQNNVYERIGMSNATASRAVSHWTKFKMPKREGLNFLTTEIDPEDRRYRRIQLNEDGLSLVHKLVRHIG